MRISSCCLIAFLTLISCGEKIIEPPEDLISEEQMTTILYDLAILNSFKSTDPSVLKKNSIELMPFIFKKHGIDSTQFVNSDIYYASIPLKYQTIYEKVEERIANEVTLYEKNRKRSADSLRTVSKQRTDSLKNLKKPKTKDSLLKKQ